jgi:hypothetical protein
MDVCIWELGCVGGCENIDGVADEKGEVVEGGKGEVGRGVLEEAVNGFIILLPKPEVKCEEEEEGEEEMEG